MAKRFLLLLLVLSASTLSPVAQEPQQGKNVFRVDVDLVQVNVAVTDGHGNYLTGLKPSNFVVTEDGIAEKIATFAEGNEPQVSVDVAQAATKRPASEGSPATLQKRSEEHTSELQSLTNL